MGMINRVVSDAELESHTMALARSLASGPRVAIAYMKQNLNLAEHGSLEDVLEAECLRHIACAGTAEHRDAVQAFMNKRAG